ncbi:MAG: FkbM family methyltransferase [Paracoccaceae bacterium]
MDQVLVGQSLHYLRTLWDGFSTLRVVDIGANPIEGDAPYKSLLDNGFCHLTGFEPQAEALAALNARKSGAETYFSNALGDGNDATLQLFQHSGFTSVFPVRADTAQLLGFHRATQSTGQLAIKTTRLDDIAGIGRIDYLKIDVQGSELNIISNGKNALQETVLVQTEVRFLPLYDGEPSFGDLDRELRQQGFQFHDFDFLKRGSLRSASHGRLKPRCNRQVIDGDAFYIRDLTKVGEMSNEQLFRLAFLAESVVKSPNLVLFCLDNLASKGAVGRGASAGYLATLPENLLREV